MVIYFARSSVSFREYAKKEIMGENKYINLFEGTFLIYTDIELKKMIEIADKSIFITNIFPVYFMKGDMQIEKIELLVNDIDESHLLDRENSFKIETFTFDAAIHSRDLEVKIGMSLENKGYKVDFKDPEQILFIVLYEDNLYSGILNKDIVLYKYLSPEKRFSREGNKLNRAQNKLTETIERFDLELDGGNALDIGAAPGGWTKILLEHGYKVYAVDPGILDESLWNHPNIIHMKQLIEPVTFEEEKFDLILNDMNSDPIESIEIINKLRKHLKKNSYIIVTIKLVSKNVDRHLKEVKEHLDENLEIIKIKHLNSNRQEFTVLLKNIG